MGRLDLPDVARDEGTVERFPMINGRIHRRGMPLTARHMQVLAWMADGRTNQEIADRLGLSLETVKGHARAVLYRLDAKTRSHAVAIGFRRGLIT